MISRSARMKRAEARRKAWNDSVRHLVPEPLTASDWRSQELRARIMMNDFDAQPPRVRQWMRENG